MSNLPSVPKAGDYLAFEYGYHREWEIHKVTKVTPSGRFECGPYTCDSNGRVRGERTPYGPTHAEPVTQEIRDQVELRQLRRFFSRIDAKKLNKNQLRAIQSIVQDAST